MKTVFLKLNEDEKTSSKALLINDIITLDDESINIGNYLNKDTSAVLFKFNYQQMILLNLTKVSPYILLFFDKSFLFKGASHSITSGIGSFSIRTEYKHVLFVKIPNDLKLDTIVSLSI